MFSEKTSTHIKAIAKKNGFLGTQGNKFIFQRGPVFKASITLELGLPESLKELDELEYYKIKDMGSTLLKAEVCSLLSGDLFVKDISASEMLEVDNLQKHYNSLQLYKVSGDHVGDRNFRMSSGYSLVAFNQDTNFMVNWKNVSPDAVLARRGIERHEVPSRKEIPEVVLKFNPLIPDLVFRAKDEVFGTEGDLTYVNTASPPYWIKEGPYKDLDPVIGPFISKLINHLFPLHHEREYVLDWCHHLLFKRNGTVLCMAGDRGCNTQGQVQLSIF
jgi:hypothetical protein